MRIISEKYSVGMEIKEVSEKDFYDTVQISGSAMEIKLLSFPVKIMAENDTVKYFTN